MASRGDSPVDGADDRMARQAVEEGSGRMSESYECPFCLESVPTVVIVIPALRMFEAHLDQHMVAGDELAVAS